MGEVGCGAAGRVRVTRASPGHALLKSEMSASICSTPPIESSVSVNSAMRSIRLAWEHAERRGGGLEPSCTSRGEARGREGKRQ